MLPCGKSHEARGYQPSHSKPKSELRLPFTCAHNTHPWAHSTFSATDFHCKWVFCQCFQAKNTALLKGSLHHVFHRLIKSDESCDLYSLHSPLCFHLKSRFQPINSRLYTVASAYGAWREGFYSYRGQHLAASLMGYGPQLHLFQWISLHGLDCVTWEEAIGR